MLDRVLYLSWRGVHIRNLNIPCVICFKALDKEIKQHVEKETAVALESTEPDLVELGSDVYKTDVPIIMRSANIFKNIVNLPNM